MEMFYDFLVVIGSLTLIWLAYKAIKRLFVLMGALFEAGFRDKFPYDFMMHFGWIISEMKSKGYCQNGMMDAGGNFPGVIMKNPTTDVEMEIRLRAPLLSGKGYSIIIANRNNDTAIVMQDSASAENKKLLGLFLEFTEGTVEKKLMFGDRYGRA